MRLFTAILVCFTGTAACATTTLPQIAIEHNAAGVKHLEQGNLDAAEARFHVAAEYHPQFVEPRTNLGLVAMARGDLNAAEKHLRSATELNSDFAEAWGNLGIVLVRKNRRRDAKLAFIRALSINPGLANARHNLALLLIQTNEFGPARAQLMRLIEVRETDDNARGLLAYCDYRLGRKSSALQRAEEVLAHNDKAAVAYIVRGMIRAERGDKTGAANDLSLASKDPVFGVEAKRRLAYIVAYPDP